MTVIQPTRFDAPTIEGRKGELLDVARVLDGGAWLEPTGLFDTFNCLRPTTVAWNCPPSGAKDFTKPPGWVDGTKFFAYLGATCKSVGYDQSEAESEISRVFDLNESFAVEQKFQSGILNGAPAVQVGTFPPTAALALLEQDAAEKYAGVPTIHMSRGVASLLSSMNVLEVQADGSLRTKLGSKVVAGGGYVSTAMWASGEVTIVRGDKHVDQVFNQSTNEVGTLAERAYIAAADCYTAYVAMKAIAPDTLSDPVPGDSQVDTGTDELVGPGATWTAPATGSLRNVSVVVTNGSAIVDGNEITAPNTINFDADSGETLDPPVVEAQDAGDRAVVYWVVAP
jgi:hypothetical protein